MKIIGKSARNRTFYVDNNSKIWYNKNIKILGGFTMKCKIRRKLLNKRLRERRLFFKELQKLNPKRSFWMKDNRDNKIYVDTYELHKIVLPEGWKVVFGNNFPEIKVWGYMKLVMEDWDTMYIYSF